MWATIAAMLEFGTITFWVVILLYSFLCMYLLEGCEREDQVCLSPIFIITIIFGAIFYFAGPLKFCIQWVMDNKTLTAGLIVAYVVVGCLYSLLKFWCFMNKLKERYLVFKEEWIVKNINKKEYGKSTPSGALFVTQAEMATYKIPDTLQVSWQQDVRCGGFWSFASGELRISEYKPAIMSWIIWWPLSGIWFIINEPVKRMANYMYAKLKGVYAWIYRKTIGDIQHDFNDKVIAEKFREIRSVNKDKSVEVTTEEL